MLPSPYTGKGRDFDLRGARVILLFVGGTEAAEAEIRHFYYLVWVKPPKMLDPSFLNNIFLIRLVHVEGVSDLNLSLDPQKTLYHCLVTSGHLN